MHRLDAGTSGLMVVARNLYSKQRLMDSFKSRSVKKEYLALVIGEPKEPKGTIKALSPGTQKQAQDGRRALRKRSHHRVQGALEHGEIFFRALHHPYRQDAPN